MSDSLGDRMKCYEDASRIKLIRRTPVIIRIDGRAFHSFVRQVKAQKPFDERLIGAMTTTAQSLCKEIMGCKLAYLQSDEISLLLTDWEKHTTQAWFDNDLRKICSLSASIATATFNDDYVDARILANFDSRAFNIPREEVCNYFIWRQQDAEKNSVSMYARSLYSHKQLIGKNGSQMQEMMFQKGFNWNDAPAHTKRGFCVVKAFYEKGGATRSHWLPDLEIPRFTQNRDYIEKFLL